MSTVGGGKEKEGTWEMNLPSMKEGKEGGAPLCRLLHLQKTQVLSRKEGEERKEGEKKISRLYAMFNSKKSSATTTARTWRREGSERCIPSQTTEEKKEKKKKGEGTPSRLQHIYTCLSRAARLIKKKKAKESISLTCTWKGKKERKKESIGR